MTIHLRTDEGQRVIAIDGRFDFNVHRDFRDCADNALATENVREVVVDLSSVDYMDSSALGMLLVLRDKASRLSNIAISIRGARGTVKQVLDIANIGKLFPIS